jgi:carboxymethylenebutenolidase
MWLRRLSSDGNEFEVYRLEAVGDSRGEVVICHEIFGVNPHIQRVCKQFAEAGFGVTAPALFDRTSRRVSNGYSEDDIERGRELVRSTPLEATLLDMAATIEAIPNGVDVGVVGYCFGGTIAWASAGLDRVACSVAYYASGIAALVEMSPACPVMLHFGDHDHVISPDTIATIQQLHPDVEVHVYPSDGHGFNCDERPSYNAESARLAFERTVSFLHQHLEADGRG